MSFFAEMRELRQWVREQFDALPSLMFGFTNTATSSAMGTADAVETADGATTQRPALRTETWGFRGRPPKGLRSFWIRLGTSNVIQVGLLPPAGYGSNALDDGESLMYSAKNKAVVLADKNGKTTATSVDSGGATKTKIEQNDDGSILITSLVGGASATLSFDNAGNVIITPPGGKTIQLGGTTGGVVRVGDHGDVGKIKIALVGTTTGTITYTDPDGVVTAAACTGIDVPLKSKATVGSSITESG